MMKFSIVAAAFVLAPALLLAQKKEQFQEMQRDILQIQDQVRTMNDKLTRLETLIQQTLDASNRANTSVATLQGSLAERIGDVTKNMVGPVAGVGTKVDQMTEEFRAVRENVADMTGRIGRLENKVNDLGNAVRTMSAPPVAPPSDSGTTAPTASAPAVPAMSADQAYQAALTDYTKGNLDLAMQEFRDYIRAFPQTEYAPNAQFYIAETFRRKGDLNGAVDAYNQVIDGYKENNKTADAFYMKGVTLVQAGKPTAARKEFNELIKRYPNSDLASKAKSQLKTLGFAPPPGKSAAAARTKKHK
jgi:tol-pal system protein YbgF